MNERRRRRVFLAGVFMVVGGWVGGCAGVLSRSGVPDLPLDHRALSTATSAGFVASCDVRHGQHGKLTSKTNISITFFSSPERNNF